MPVDLTTNKGTMLHLNHEFAANSHPFGISLLTKDTFINEGIFNQ